MQRWVGGYERKAHILYFKPKLFEKVVVASDLQELQDKR